MQPTKTDRAAPLAPARSLSHLAVNVSDLERSRAFYDAVLGFELFLDKRDDPKLPRLFGKIAGVPVELLGVPPLDTPVPPRNRQFGLVGMVFRVDDLDAICARLFAAGLVKVEKPKMFEGAKVLYVADPDGSYFELIEFPDGKQSPDETWAEPA